MRAAAPIVLGLLVAGCLPSPGPFRLEAVDGRVVDLDSGAPVSGAEIVESYRGATLPGASQPVYHARWTTSDADGRFHFAAAMSPSPRMWALETYDPVYVFFHPRYGLQRGRAAENGDVLLRASLARKEQAFADLRPFCRGELDDPGSRRIAEVGCEDALTRSQ